MPAKQATLQDLTARPRIGLTMMLLVSKSGKWPPRYCMSQAYYDAIRQAGGVPISLVPGSPEEMNLYAPPGGETPLAPDAVCLGGGGDGDPLHHGQERPPACQEPARQRAA